VVELSTRASVAAAPTSLNACCALEEISKREIWQLPSGQNTPFVPHSMDFGTAEPNEWFSYLLISDLSLLLLSKQTFEEAYAGLPLSPHQTLESLAEKRPPSWTARRDVKHRGFIS